MLVYVGEGMERFVVNTELLNHPIFINLLNQSAQEYRYEQKGVVIYVQHSQNRTPICILHTSLLVSRNQPLTHLTCFNKFLQTQVFFE
ncbi:hypothetical protein L1887_28381 [Cichorium endivia]|nr:hypothetical protein L1887_28381 [Cichorium endivia]